MQKPKPDEEPDPACACGRSRSEAVAMTYRSQSALFTFVRCECGREWTERRDGFDPAAPISGDEVIEVHQLLRRFRGPISEMLGMPSA
jgi:hypothetical protein